MIRGLLILFVAALAWPTLSHSQVPSADQLELLRSLSPEDRDALMEQLGLGGSLLSDPSQPTSPSGREAANERRESRPEQPVDEDTLRALDKRLRPDDTVLIDINFKTDKPPRVETPAPGMAPITIPGELAPVIEGEEREQLEALIELVRSRNPYRLDHEGAMLLPGFAPVVLAGLDEEQAGRRLSAIEAFRKLDIKLTKLPVRKAGSEGLKPFGYDLFQGGPSTFAPVTDVPVPADYIVGPGDQIQVQLFGNQNRTLRLIVGRDGRINFPELGPINVAGRPFERVAEELEQRVSQQMLGVRASVGMGDTRSIRVFVMGEANRAGTYVVSGLATITSALYAAGGVRPIGSLRNVQLKRQGAIVRHLDLYDLLLRGDTSDDSKLLPGDVIFIPPASATVSVSGEVQRPAIYELKGETSVSDIIALAGGLTNEADTSRVALVRVDENRARVVVNVPLDQAQGRQELLRRGDSLRVLRLRPTIDRGVVLDGHVHRPGVVAWNESLRLTDVIGSVDELKPDADLHYVMIRREQPPDRHIEVVSADLAAALRAPDSPKNIRLMPRDRIVVFSVEAGRKQLLDPILDEMHTQSSLERPTKVVRVDGRVKARGDYPLEPQMRISDLLRAGGGLQDAAYGATAELTRYRVEGTVRSTEVIDIDLAAIANGDLAADVLLHPFDFLNVKEIPEWSGQEQVTLGGEVRFPGIYPIRRGETLRSVLDRAGGLTSLAFTSGAVFMRKELQEREQQQIDRLAERLQGDLAVGALQAAAANQGQAGQAITVGQTLLAQLKTSKALGRLVIDLDTILASARGSKQDIVLRDGDRLMIPKQKQEVTVIGEVQTTTSHVFSEHLMRDDYIEMSGGATRKADRGRIYIVRADGSVVSSESRGWFRRSAHVAVRPGDTIVVPLNTERLPPLPFWQAVTGIVYNLAITAAAIGSF
jgi:protein involved in polysaccharide export with SLBB domain